MIYLNTAMTFKRDMERGSYMVAEVEAARKRS